MKIKCSRCGSILKKPGALLFGPPYTNKILGVTNIVKKYHICCKCFIEIMRII